MIVFKTNMKELPKSCNDCELFDNVCKLSFKILKYKNKRYKYCPLVNIEKPILLDIIDKSNEIKLNDGYDE